jgi:hypothetical protein
MASVVSSTLPGRLIRVVRPTTTRSVAERKTSLPKSRWGFVPHPRYGDKPRHTGLDVRNLHDGVHLRCWTEGELEAWAARHSLAWIDPALVGSLIPGTAIVADPSRQRGSCMLNTHYYDIQRKCRDCGRLFIFFAEEQRYWYEELQFPVDADCVRCHPCRQRHQALNATRRSYETLLHVESPGVEELLELTLARLDLVEAGLFHPRQLERVRAFLRQHPDHERSPAIRARLEAVSRTTKAGPNADGDDSSPSVVSAESCDRRRDGLDGLAPIA